MATALAPLSHRPFSQAQIAAQEDAYFAGKIAELRRLYDKSGARDEERETFLELLCDHVKEQAAELDRASEENRETSMHEHQRTWFEGTRGLA